MVTLPPKTLLTLSPSLKFTVCATPRTDPLFLMTMPCPIAVTPVSPDPSPMNVPVVIPESNALPSTCS